MDQYPIQTNFTTGEVSPQLLGRVDISKYANGAAKVENFLVKPQGGLTRRSGTRYITGTPSNAQCRLIRFEYSNIQVYMLEFGQNTLRIISGGALVLNGGSPIVLNTPYNSSDLVYLKYTQSADEMYITHPNYPPMLLSRLSPTSWTFTPITFNDGLEKISVDGPYLDVDKRNYTMALTGITGTIEISSTNADFSSGSVGKYVIFNGSVYSIIGYIDSQHVNVVFYSTLIQPNFTGFTVTYTGSSITINSVTYPGYFTITGTNPWGFWTASGYVPGMTVKAGSTYYYSGNYYYPSNGVVVGVINYNLTIQTTTGTLAIVTSAISIYNAITITDTAADFTTGSIGKYIEYNFEGNVVIGLIAVIISSTQVIIRPYVNIVDGSALDPNAAFSYAASGITINGVAFVGQLYASVAVWTNTAQYSFIKINGTWYLTGFHYDGTTSVNGLSQDVMAVQFVCTMQTVTGNLSYSNHVIIANLGCSNPVFNSATDVGRCFRLNFNSLQVWGTITMVNSTTSCLVSLGGMIPNDPQTPSQLVANAQTSVWQLGAWYVGNYPAVMAFHEQRLTFAATTVAPNTFWMSNSGDYFNFAPTDPASNVLASNAITATIASNRVNVIMWMQTNNGVLLMGTLGAEWEATSSSYGSPLAPNNIVCSEQTNHGSIFSAEQQKVGSRILFVQRSGNKIKELVLLPDELVHS